MSGDVGVGDLRRWAASQLKGAGVDEAVRSADWMLEDVIGCSRAELVGNPDRPVAGREESVFRDMVARRIRGEPVQYIVGWTVFYGLRFSVSPAVLIPRPETETLVDVALELVDDVPGPSVLDVGTGSGCIAIALGSVRSDAMIRAVDSSPAALEVARSNARTLGVPVDFEVSDLRDEGFAAEGGPVDLIVSNPPYVHPAEMSELPREVKDYEPYVALFTGEDPLEYYRLLLARSVRLLRAGGALAVEVHEDRAGGVAALFEEQGLSGAQIRRDLAGRERVVLGRRT